VVVVAAQSCVTGLGQDVGAGGTAATAAGSTGGGGLALLDGALFGEQVEVTADRCGRQAQARGKGDRGERAILGDRPPDPVPGARLKTVRAGVGTDRRVGDGIGSDKHNSSVT
jgi:hypothetical protein